MKGILEFGFRPQSLTDCLDVWSLAFLLGTDYDKLSKLLYRTSKIYRQFKIDKKNGGFRTLLAPNNHLKAIQQSLKLQLEQYYSPRAGANGFIKGRSIVTNAIPHVGKKYVLNLDLKDFFTSVHFGRVRKLFEGPPFNLPPEVSAVLAQICCYKNALPQGAPTSPIISNMILFKMDRQLKELASIYRGTYSRYADDITFSFNCNKNKLPKDVVYCDSEGEVYIGHALSSIINNNGFEINEAKTRLQHRSQHQGVTGITVNQKLNVSRTFIRQTSSMINALNKYGSFKAETEHFDKYSKGYVPERQLRRRKVAPGDLFIKKIKGRLNYIRMIKGASCDVYRKLMYKYTCALGKPNEEFAKSWLDVIAESTFVLNNYADITQGSCFIVDKLGIVTNHHVLQDVDAHNFSKDVIVCSWKSYKQDFKLLEFYKSSPELDLAFIKPDNHIAQFKQLQLSSSFSYKKGAQVFTIGYPNHKEGDEPTIIKAKIVGEVLIMGQRRIKLSENIRHGNSGGVVVDSDGKVIGVVSNGNALGASTQEERSFIPIEVAIKYFEDD
jgi:retron-type reverse transcriptase